jgi:tRNA(Ile)-lysidine synthase
MSKLLETVEAGWPSASWADVHVLVAVSGGADSMALLRVLLELKHRARGAGEVVALHVNHQIHAAADADAAWVCGQLQALGVKHQVCRVDAPQEAAARGDGMEAAARGLRYAALQRAAEELGARFVATAHTADDQVETVLHRIIRGTGVEGVAGIPRRRPLGPTTALVRPFLGASRRDVVDYLAELGQPYCEDPTNRDPSYMRNRIRRELLPHLRSEYNPRVDEAILRLARQAEELLAVLQREVAELAAETVRVSPDEIVLDAARLRGTPEPLVREVLRSAWRSAGWPEQQMSDAGWRRLSDLLRGGPTRGHLPGSVDAEVTREAMRLSRPGT